MSIPKSKMLSASRAIMAIANRTRETREISNKTVQNQTVNITLPRNNETPIQHPTIVSYPGITDPSATFRCPNIISLYTRSKSFCVNGLTLACFTRV